MLGAPAWALRAAGVAGLVVPPLAAALVVAAGLATPGYDAARWSISRLGERGAPDAVAVNVTLALVGVTVGLLSWALRGAGEPGWQPLGLGAVGLVALAVVSRDPARPEVVAAHRFLSFLTFLALAAAPALAWRASAWGRGGQAVVPATAALLSAGVLLLSAVFLVAGIPLLGLCERVLLAVQLGWLMLISVRLLRLDGARLDRHRFDQP